MLLSVNNVQVDLVKATKGKRRVSNAVPVNSTMLPVRSIVHCVQIRRTLVTREETAVASIVQLVGRPKTAVRNVSRAVPVRLASDVKIVLQVMPEQETTTMRRNANNVNWVKQQRLKVLLNVIHAMLGHLAKPKVFVQHARMDSIKIPKVKRNAVTFASH